MNDEIVNRDLPKLLHVMANAEAYKNEHKHDMILATAANMLDQYRQALIAITNVGDKVEDGRINCLYSAVGHLDCRRIAHTALTTIPT